MRQYCLAMGLLAVVGPAWADDPAFTEPVPIGLPGAAGVLRGRTQVMFDPGTRALVRRWIQVWDAQPDRGRAFTWTPEQIPPTGAAAQGKGQLTWREAGAPTYDPAAILSVYRGTLRAGRPEGDGSEIDRDGTRYAGQWRGGRPEGQGRLRLNDGAEYDGVFHAGMAEGRGRFVDIDGETYDGLFRKGLREGIATTVLPNRARYQSRWHAGIEDAASRRVRLAQAGGAAAALDQDIRIGLSVVERPANSYAIQYTSMNSSDILKIFPDNERLMSLWKGNGELQTGRLTDYNDKDAPTNFTNPYHAVFDLQKGDISPLQLSISAQNKSGKAIQIAGGFVNIEISSTDYQPAVQLSADPGDQCGGQSFYAPRFELQNMGWGPVEHPIVRFDFRAVSDSQPFQPRQLKRLEGFQTVRTVDFEPDLVAGGVMTGLLRQLAAEKKPLSCQLDTPTDCLNELKRKGVFGRLSKDVFLTSDRLIMLGIKGVLDYEWKDSFGSYQQRESPFTVQLPLGKLPETAECGEGGEAVPIAINPVALQLDRSNYRLPLTFERSLPPGRTARYSFALKAAKASRHRFTVVLQLADGREISSRPVDLTYFVPNWKLLD